MYSWALPCVSSLVPSVLHLSHGFRCSPTLNRQPYEGRLPLTSWWRKSSGMTVGQCSLICLACRCCGWRPGGRCGWICGRLASGVDGGMAGGRLRWSILAWCVTPQSGGRVSTSLGSGGLCWAVFARSGGTAVPAEGDGSLQTLICVLVARPRRCLTLSNPVPWRDWMVACLGCALRVRTLFRGWPIMVNDTHTRRRRSEIVNVVIPVRLWQLQSSAVNVVWCLMSLATCDCWQHLWCVSRHRVIVSWEIKER